MNAPRRLCTALVRLLALGGLLLCGVASQVNVVAAQDVMLPEPVLLREGRPAPFTGQLLAQSDVLAWANQIEDLEHRLVVEVQRAADICEARLTGERARTQAASETTTLHDTLYQQRIDVLAQQLQEARNDAIVQWYEHPALWFSVGVLVAVAVVVVAASVR